MFNILGQPRGQDYDLQNLFQNLHPKIIFTIEHTFKEQPFFEILIKNENGNITDIYQKPTNIQQYLNFNSHHH